MFASLLKLLRPKPATPDVRIRGARGEELATRYLERKGYRIVERNWRCSVGEIDIIARASDTLVVVEVKSAGKDSEFKPEFRVNHAKQERLKRLARAYMKTQRFDYPVRYDIITVTWHEDQAKIEHFEDAFI